MKSVKFLGLLLLATIAFQSVTSIRFVQQGYEILDPTSGRVLPSAYNKGNRGRVTFSPPITDELESNRNSRQLFRNSEVSSVYPEFNYKSFYFPSKPQEQNYRYRRYNNYYDIVPFKSSSTGRYQPSTKTTYAHKKRQQNPYYGRKKRSAEAKPYTLLDPFTGRNVDKLPNKKPQSSRKPLNFLFGLPFDIFQDKSTNLRPNVRTQRRIRPSEPRNPYLAENGYGRKKRAAQNNPWILLDPTTGRTLEPEREVKNQEFLNNNQEFDPLEEQFFNPGVRQNRQPANVYLGTNGTPLYKYRNKYPHGYHG